MVSVMVITMARQEFATERELCWHLCIAMGLTRQHERLAQALAQTGIDEKNQPSEYRGQAQVAHVSHNIVIVMPQLMQ